jgi:hypothetical protein
MYCAATVGQAAASNRRYRALAFSKVRGHVGKLSHWTTERTGNCRKVPIPREVRHGAIRTANFFISHLLGRWLAKNPDYTHRRSRTPIVELKDNALWDIELDGSAKPNCVGPRFNLTHLTNGVRHTLPSTLIGPQWPSLSSTIARYVLWSCDAADVPLKVLCSHEARETKTTAKMAFRIMAEC